MSDRRPTTYWDYIRVEELLALQGGRDEDEAHLSNGEVLFITVHQVFELWFKLVLRELTAARDLFTRDSVAEQELSGAAEGLQRVTTILRTASQHFEVVETLGTHEYLEFRNKLTGASGFQSAQLRQIEILFGLGEDERIPLGLPGSHISALRAAGGGPSPALARVERQLADLPTLKDAIARWLRRTPIDGVAHDAPDADEKLGAFIARFLEAHGSEVEHARAAAVAITDSDEDAARLGEMYARERAAVHAFLHPSDDDGGRRRARERAAMVFIETYRELPLLAWPRRILAGLLEVEQAFLIFRQRHARMVERVIGRRVGTGGSAGVEYLDQTALTYRIFRDLWAVRTLIVKPGAAPPLDAAAFYGFRAGE